MYFGIVFDFDGVLYDSEKHWDKVENRYLISRVPNWNPSDYKYLVGSSIHEAYSYLSSRGFTLSEEKYLADYNGMAMELYSNLTKPLPYVDVLLQKLALSNTKLAIASSSKRAWLDTALQSSNLPVTFTTIATSDDPLVGRGKPAPDVYLRAADLLNEPASKLISIEDSKNGVASAKAAGLYCLGLRNGFNEDQDLSESDDIIHGYSPENIQKILNLIA